MVRTRNLFRQQGLTLTETVTALLLLGIGVLCIASVYLERSQAAPAVLLHSKANRLAAEMAEYMRSQNNPVRFENPIGSVCQTDLTLGKIQSQSPQQVVPLQTQQLANNAVACWQDKIARTLPNGAGAISMDEASKPPAYLIIVSWSPPGGGTASYLLRLEHAMPTPTLKSNLPAAQ